MWLSNLTEAFFSHLQAKIGALLITEEDAGYLPGKKTLHNHQISQYLNTYLIKVKIKCLWKVVELDLDGFFLVSFFWKFTSEGNRLGSCLNLAASCKQKFMQHVTSYRGVWHSGSCDVQTNLDMLVTILTWHFNIHRHSAMLTENFWHREMSSKELSIPWPQYLAFFAIFVYDKNLYKCSR